MAKTLKCKNCKEKHSPFNSLDNWCNNIDCQTAKAMHMLKNKRIQDEKESKKNWAIQKKAIKDKNGWNTKKPPKDVFQDEVNKLVRIIDNHFNFPCISCGNINEVKYDAGHRISKGANLSLRYNLHNIHKQCSKNCNTSLSGNPDGYDQGLIHRYNLKYKNFVKYELRKEFNYVNLGGVDYTEKIKLVRKLIRDFETFKLTSSISARIMFNNIIGIYKSDILAIDFTNKDEDNLFDNLF